MAEEPPAGRTVAGTAESVERDAAAKELEAQLSAQRRCVGPDQVPHQQGLDREEVQEEEEAVEDPAPVEEQAPESKITKMDMYSFII